MPDVGSDPARDGPPRVSRRSLLLGVGAAAVVVAGGGTAAFALRPTPPPVSSGLRVTPLLAKRAFTVAYRGGSLDWPEESMYAYSRSVAAGVDALEISVARTSDGVWFGLHDPTLDRTSGTAAIAASSYPWNQIKRLRIRANGTKGTAQPPRPYTRLDELLEAYGSTHAIFLDPKSVDSRYYPELLALVETHVADPTETMIAKSYCTNLPWAKAARQRGYETWGFYYATEVAAKPALLTDTQEFWSMLGLDWDADSHPWALLRSYGKPVIAHVVPNAAAATSALAQGASGLMVSGVSETLPKLRAAQR